MNLITSTLLLLTYSTVASLAAAQATPPTASAAASAPASPSDNVEDLTSSVLTSPSAPPPAGAPAPGPSAAPPATQSVTNAGWPTQAAAPAPSAVATPQIAPPEEPAVPPSRGIRHGFYIRANNGIGFAGFRGSGPGGNVSIQGLGALTAVAIGGSIGRGVVLAGTLQAASITAKFKGGPFEDQTIAIGDRTIAASPKADATFSQIGLLIDWYPEPSLGWHVGASGGWGLISVLNRADDSTIVGASLGSTIFGGYDWFIAKEWSMGLSLIASGVASANMKEAKEGTDAGYKLRGLSIGIAGSVLYF